MRRLATMCIAACALSCRSPTEPEAGRDYRLEMANLVVDLSRHARGLDADFEIVLQNGHEVLFAGGTASSAVPPELRRAVAGVARESLLYGYDGDDRPTPDGPRAEMLSLAQGAQQAGLVVLTVDYCTTPEHVDGAYRTSSGYGFVPFAAPRRELDVVPGRPQPPFAAHADSVDSLAAARNFLYLINPGRYADAEALVADLSQTEHDLLILDAFVDEAPLTQGQVEALARKPDGARRLVFAYLSIGEAEIYRHYFEPEWIVHPPSWLAAENPQWQGNYKVRYWDPAWQAILFGTPDAYLDRIVEAGFDGAYLDIIDAFEYFESGGT